MRRYENQSAIMPSNRLLEEWRKRLGDVPTAGAIPDRFLHDAQTIAITERSYRLKDNAAIAGKEDKNRKSKSKPNDPGCAGGFAEASLRPQNRRAEWLAFRLCLSYFAACKEEYQFNH